VLLNEQQIWCGGAYPDCYQCQSYALDAVQTSARDNVMINCITLANMIFTVNTVAVKQRLQKFLLDLMSHLSFIQWQWFVIGLSTVGWITCVQFAWWRNRYSHAVNTFLNRHREVGCKRCKLLNF